ncbi:Mobile element protein (plasmid) [Sinorhizobium fredii CCBAU 83666]|nr:Mobile element protein [Sinorhizobium fredii CCBAU 83666]
MGSAVLLRDDFDGGALRQLARQTKDANQARRLLALAEIYDGGSRTDAARIGSVTLQIVRDWVLRFNSRGPDGLVNGKAPGGRAKLNDAQRQALAKIVESGPIPAIHGVVRWRRKDLVQWIFQEFRISIDETTVGRELKALGFAKLSARPRHYAQNEPEAAAFKKTSPPRSQKSEPSSRRTRISNSGGPTKRA